MTDKIKGDEKVSAFYVADNGEAICVWQHTPQAEVIRDTVVVICPPFGSDYTHAYRSLRRMAEQLCAAGFVVIRFDYYGTGDSSGSPLDKDCLQRWVANIGVLSDKLRDTFADFKQCWLGLRVGATLATLAAENHRVDSLILWEPVIRGRGYIRELEALSRLSYAEKDDAPDYLESAGFIISQQTADQIKDINLLKQNSVPPGCRVLHLVRDDAQLDEAFVQSLRQRDIEAEIISAPGYADMMVETHNTRVPQASIECVIRWLQGISESKQKPVETQIDGVDTIEIMQSGVRVEDTCCFFGESSSLFGVLTDPVHADRQPDACVILSNSGSVHHVGPNAVYTVMGHRLAALNYYVFRIDQENLGDSDVLNRQMENHPYQDNATKNIQDAINFIREKTGITRFIVSGICSGAYTAFHSGLELSHDDVSELMIINPLTFYWTPDLSLDTPSAFQTLVDESYYKQSLRSFDKWKRLLTFQANWKYIISFVMKRAAEFLRQLWKDSRASIFGEHTRLANDLKAIHQKGVGINFIFSSTDPGLSILRSQAKHTVNKGVKENWIKIQIVNGADHTFSRKKARDELLSKLDVHFSKHH